MTTERDVIEKCAQALATGIDQIVIERLDRVLVNDAYGLGFVLSRNSAVILYRTILECLKANGYSIAQSARPPIRPMEFNGGPTWEVPEDPATPLPDRVTDEMVTAAVQAYNKEITSAGINRQCLRAAIAAALAIGDIGTAPRDGENKRLRAAMIMASAMLKCPAAEYVPAMSEAWEVLDEAISSTPPETQSPSTG